MAHKREGEGSGKVMATDCISGLGNWKDDCVEMENAKGAELSIENATSGMTVPFHAGAAKYFAEKGVEVN